jgi:hypothetical protein
VVLAGRELLGRSSCDPLRSSPSEEERRWEGLRQLLGCGGAGNARNEPLQCTAHFLTEPERPLLSPARVRSMPKQI